MSTLPKITLVSDKSSMIREWRNAFLSFPEIFIVKDTSVKQNNLETIEINANGLISQNNNTKYKHLIIPKEIKNLDFFHIGTINLVPEKNLVIIPTSISKNATKAYSTYLPMLSLLEFLAKTEVKKDIYIHPIGEMNLVSQHNIAIDMARAYGEFVATHC